MGIFGDILGFIGGNQDRNAQKDANYENAALQREFAQNGIQWRVDDAKRAGISPLAAMGAQLFNPTPSFMASGSDRGSSYRDMGQSIDRAVSATMNRDERAKKERMDEALIRKAEAEAALVEGQASRASQPTNPPMPTDPALSVVPGQGDAFSLPAGTLLPPPVLNGGTVQEQPFQRTMSEPARPEKEAGIINDFQFVRRGDGRVGVLPSQDSKNRMEDMGWTPWAWSFATAFNPPKMNVPPAKGMKWIWNPITMEWKQKPIRNDFQRAKKWFRDTINAPSPYKR